MCGDFDTDEARAEALYARFVDHARAFLAGLESEPGRNGDELYDHLDALFRDTLAATAAHAEEEPGQVSGYERLCMEPLVYARLAGFMAAHQPLEDDPLRGVIEAMMTGYAEGEASISERDHGHLHDHDHTH
jgi:hypothetical protein